MGATEPDDDATTDSRPAEGAPAPPDRPLTAGADEADPSPTGSEPTVERPFEPPPTAAWPAVPPAPPAPPAASTALRPPVPPAWPLSPASEASAPEASTGGPGTGAPPAGTVPPAPALGPSPRRSALIGGIAGAVVAAVVATGISVALDDDDAATVPGGPVATPVTTEEGALDIQGILTKVQPSVVAIESSRTTSRGVFEGAGSGVILSADGLVLTNSHVLGSLGDITVVLPDGSREEATLVGASPDDDLAVIRIEGVDDLVPAELGSSDGLRVGDEVIAIGNALNLGGEPTVTRGIVSAKDRSLTAEGVALEALIQTDAAINPGNSGGPLVNVAGQVVGINTAIVADAQNLGFSISIDHARPVIEALESGQGRVTPDQAFLGVSSTDIEGVTDDLRDRYGVEVDEGAFVTDVVPGSAAEDGGVEIGDVIIEVDGDAITEPEDVRDAVIGHEPGDEVEIVVLRDGRERSLSVTLGRRGDDT